VTRRQGDKGTRGQADKAKRGKEEREIFYPSPSLLVPLSPCPSPSGPKIRIEGLKKIWKKRYEEKLKLS
jgi:hypothetical protein